MLLEWQVVKTYFRQKNQFFVKSWTARKMLNEVINSKINLFAAEITLHKNNQQPNEPKQNNNLHKSNKTQSIHPSLDSIHKHGINQVHHPPKPLHHISHLHQTQYHHKICSPIKSSEAADQPQKPNQLSKQSSKKSNHTTKINHWSENTLRTPLTIPKQTQIPYPPSHPEKNKNSFQVQSSESVDKQQQNPQKGINQSKFQKKESFN